MPEVCRFYGIVIRMYFGDHAPPHFHARYGEHEAVISIETLTVLGGNLPPRALGLVMEWAALRREELREAWEQGQSLTPIRAIEPLR